MSSFVLVHVNNKTKSILIFVEGPTQGLDDITLTAEAKNPINFTQPRKRFVLSLHYTESGNFLFVNAKKMYQFEGKDPEMKDCTLCLDNISKDFTINIKKTGLKGSVNFCFLLILILLILTIFQISLNI